MEPGARPRGRAGHSSLGGAHARPCAALRLGQSLRGTWHHVEMRPKALLGAAVAAGAGVLGYASVIERNWFTLRRYDVPVLRPGARPLRVLHISDAHLTPGRHRLMSWIRSLDVLQPDLVVNTGDSIAHPHSVRPFLEALGPLLDRPGVFVYGSNDLYTPTPRNPARYLWRDSTLHPNRYRPDLPWAELGAGMAAAGWMNAPAGPSADRRLGVMRSPEPSVMDRFAADGFDLMLAGHTHGGQVCVPFYGSLVTNCGIDRTRASGLHRHPADSFAPRQPWLHVSAGLGTSPWAPFRLACRPEASLLTLVPRDS